MKSIIVICFYFGEFPDWFSIYFDSLKRNKTIDFLFYTDCDFQKYKAENVKFISIKYENYVEMIKEKTKINFTPNHPYKICDFRPLLGIIHNEEIRNYDFYGYADVDLIFGDIRSFYTEDLLSKYDVLSTHQHTLSDHFILFKNSYENLNMYKFIGGWKEKLESSECVGIGEDYLLHAYKKYIDNQNKRFLGLNKYLFKYFGLKLYLEEQYTTPFTPFNWLDGTIFSNHPSEWYYINGKVTNNRDIGKEFMYLHLMNFKSSKYRHDDSKAPWENISKITHVKDSDVDKGVVISLDGINNIKINGKS